MQYRKSHLLARRSDRRGIAPLEFVMGLPVLLLLMIAITWLGFSVIGQTQAIVEARNKAWKRRFEDTAKKPLMFPSGISVAKNPFYSAEADYVTEKVTGKVDVSPIFRALPGLEGSHTILAGSWDHRAMPFDKPPEWELLAKAAANGTTGSVQTWSTLLNDPLGRIQDLGSNILADNANRRTEAQNSNTASNTGPNAGQAQQAEEKAKRDRAAEKRKYEERLEKLGGRIDFLNPNRIMRTYPDGEYGRTIDEWETALAQLNAKKLVQPSKDEEAEKKRLEELAQAERKVQLLDGKRQRIESEIRDADANLKALG